MSGAAGEEIRFEEALAGESDGRVAPGPGVDSWGAELDVEIATPIAGSSPLASDRSRELDGPRKAAIFVLSLDEEAASRVLRCLSDDELGAVAAEIARLGVVDRDTVESVRVEFEQIGREVGIVQEGGVGPARRLLEGALSPERARRMVDLLGADRPRRLPAFLRDVDAGCLVAALRGEHPATIAAVLAHCAPGTAAGALDLLAEGLRKDVISRISSLEPVNEDALEALVDVVSAQLESVRFAPAGQASGIELAAEIVRAGGGRVGAALTADLRQRRPELAAAVEKRLFSFADLARLEDRHLRRVLEGVEARVLALALKNCEPRVSTKVLRNLPRRRAARVRKRGASLGPVRLSEVEDARRQVVDRALSRVEGPIDVRTDGRASR